MSAAPAGSIDAALDEFEAFLKKRGLKVTAQRRTMVRAALAHAGHFTAEDVHATMREEGLRVSLATVYRALSLLEEAGVIEGHDFADGQRRYERAFLREHHDHLICLDCRAVVEFQSRSIEELQEQILAERGFKMVHHALTIFATCETLARTGRCPRRDEEAPRAGPPDREP